MISFLIISSLSEYKDDDFIITQELVDEINNNPKSTFNATLYPYFRNLRYKDIKSFLSPVRPVANHKKSAAPTNKLGSFIKKFSRTDYITGVSEQESNLSAFYHSFSNQPRYNGSYGFPIYDVSRLCSSWAASMTSAVSISVSRWAGSFINFSLQYIIDCDPVGDYCIDRPIEKIASQFLNRVPENTHWSQRNPQTQPVSNFVYSTHCANQKCYPGHTGCIHQYALTGNCDHTAKPGDCPIHAFYHWRQIQEFLFEVGPVVSSILVYPQLFAYKSGVYSSKSFYQKEVLGMIDVTIVGWGEVETPSKNNEDYWWYVIPHLGCEFGVEIPYAEKFDRYSCKRGFMKFSRRFDDSWIESMAYGPVPYNFNPYF